MRRFSINSIMIFIIFCSCIEQKNEGDESHYFQLKNRESTGITFSNNLVETSELNYFTYPYMYFGGGVASADLDNDGLPELIFTGNMVESKLYKNRGEFRFDDITRSAGIYTGDRWVTGVTTADVNNDGLLDIYFSVSGKDVIGNNPTFSRKNLLYINKGGLRFEEESGNYGLDINSMSVQAVFFDLDNDGDLDMYQATYPEAKLNSTNDFWNLKVSNPTLEESDRLFENRDGKFYDITVSSGILNYGLSLGLSIVDVNKDGNQDIYVSNDFNTPDRLFINNGDLTFRDDLREYTNQTANYGMGIDAGDINNDGFIDLYQLDMMPDNNYDKKINMGAMNHQEFIKCVDYGFHYQYMQNALQLNNGKGKFSQISQLANVAETDWSWSTILADLNNDTFKDIFVTNGIRRSVNNNDFNQSLYLKALKGEVAKENILEVLYTIPEEPKRNIAYMNTGNLVFKDNSKEWNLDYNGFSNGCVYSDLDRDEDLDIIVSNLDDYALIYENKLPAGKNYIQLALVGVDDNRFGIGTKIEVFGCGEFQYAEAEVVHGFQSSSEYLFHFGLNQCALVDSVRLEWPNQTKEVFYDINVNKVNRLRQYDGDRRLYIEASDLQLITSQDLGSRHEENQFDDYEYQYFLPFKVSSLGPALDIADYDNDGLDDIFLGNSTGNSSKILFGNESSKKTLSFTADKIYEDIDAISLDVENDGDLDIVVVTGGNEFPANSPYYKNRIYINNGEGSFTSKILSNDLISGSSVSKVDYNKDGLIDLFITGFLDPRNYPGQVSSYLFKNNGDGVFSVDDQNVFKSIGAVTDALVVDLNNDGYEDIVVVGHWMGIKYFINEKGIFKSVDGFPIGSGLWNCVEKFDLNGNEFVDLVIGNIGLNYKYKVSPSSPIRGYLNDFDKDGDNDFILTLTENGMEFPLRGRKDFVDQFRFIEEKFPSHDEFARATIDNIFESKLTNTYRVEVNEFASVILKDIGGKTELIRLPNLAQMSSINTFYPLDFDDDGDEDILFGGNLLNSEVETPRLDASYGNLLVNNNGSLTFEGKLFNDLNIKGEIRKMARMSLNGMESIVFGVNNENLIAISVKQLNR